MSACLHWADSLLIVYDVTQLDSAERTRLFLELARSVRETSRLPVLLVGNKTDMAHVGHADKAGMEILSSEFHCRHFLTSAAEDPKIIDLIFTGLVAEGRLNARARQVKSQQRRLSPAPSPQAPTATPPSPLPQPSPSPQPQRRGTSVRALKEEEVMELGAPAAKEP